MSVAQHNRYNSSVRKEMGEGQSVMTSQCTREQKLRKARVRSNALFSIILSSLGILHASSSTHPSPKSKKIGFRNSLDHRHIRIDEPFKTANRAFRNPPFIAHSVTVTTADSALPTSTSTPSSSTHIIPKPVQQPPHRVRLISQNPFSHASLPAKIPITARKPGYSSTMRGYNPFATAEEPHIAQHSTTSDHSVDPPPSPRSSYLPSVPTLPSVRKYFSLPGPSVRRLSATSNDDDEVAPSPALPELSGMIDNALGPVGQPKEGHSKRIEHDKLLAGFHASVPERNRLLKQFLRARHHNAQDALRMINSTLRWRKQVGIESYLEHPARNMVSPNACFPMHILSTPENCKQPVIFGLIRLLDKKKAERGAFQKALLSFLESIYFAETYVLDEMIIILDFRDWSIRKNAPYRLVKEGIETLQEYYPERLGRVFLVNYPTSIRAAYTAVSPIIDPGAKEKIVWVPDDDPSVTLKKFVPVKSIPGFLGGELEADFPPTWPDIAAEYEAAKSSQHGLFHYH